MSSILYEHLDYSMSPGQGTRVKECDQCQGQGRSKAVQITRKEDGFLCYCHRCEKTYFFPDKGASPTQVQEILKNASTKKVDNRPEQVALPGDFTHSMPPKALVQLYDFGIMDDDILHYEIGWSPSHSRIIIPVYKYGKGPGGWAKKLVGVMGRKLDSTDGDTDKPKWWSQRNRDVKHPRFVSLPEAVLQPKTVVIVEDIFSAIRIGNQGYLCMALLTTYLPFELYPKLRGWTVHIWLDCDAYDKATKYQAALGAHGITASTVFTKADPKTYDDNQIKEAIKRGTLTC